jgi:iron complex transport system substrate-binding protein
MGGGAPMVAGQHTAADAAFALAGVKNALSGFNGYKPANDESAMAAAPDAIVVMGERSHEMTPETVFAVPAFAGTPAAKAGRLVSLSGAYLLGFSPRMAHAAHDLAAGVYPEAALKPLPARPWTEDSGALPAGQ